VSNKSLVSSHTNFASAFLCGVTDLVLPILPHMLLDCVCLVTLYQPTPRYGLASPNYDNKQEPVVYTHEFSVHTPRVMTTQLQKLNHVPSLAKGSFASVGTDFSSTTH